ncbi:hypothetical protein HDU96_003464 [Phlyctochytrium bullatum]|nr:hypothetical protein HDU96_003464 [Phlyctochytrium bullatum]
MVVVNYTYVRYKKATGELVDWLRSSVSDPSQPIKMTANRIRDMAKAIRAAGNPVPSTVMRSLETAIELREEVMRKRNSDDGHYFFLKMLKDVRTRLLPLTKTKDKATKKKGKKEVKKEPKNDAALVNQFSVLSIDADVAISSEMDAYGEAETEHEEPDAEQSRPELEKNEMDIEDDTLWVAINCFLDEAEELLSEAMFSWGNYTAGNVPIFVPTAGTNLAISLLHKLLGALQLDYPHLMSWNYIIAVMHFEWSEMMCTKLAINTSIKMSDLKARIDACRESELFDSFHTKENLDKAYTWLESITDNCYKSLTTREKFIGMYSPYLAGQQLTMACYYVGLEIGFCVLDSNFQATLIMHYYNAFRVLGLIKELPLLEFLIEHFSKFKTTWVGGRPSKQGDFIKSFLMTWGYDSGVAAALAQGMKEERIIPIREPRSPKSRKGRQSPDPGQILPSFLPVLDNDFTSFPRECLDDVQRLFAHFKDLIVNDYDTSLVGYDLFSLGRIFLEICKKLLVATGLDRVVKIQLPDLLSTVNVDETKWFDSTEFHRIPSLYGAIRAMTFIGIRF